MVRNSNRRVAFSSGQGSVAGILLSKAFNDNGIMAIRVKQKNTEGNKMKV